MKAMRTDFNRWPSTYSFTTIGFPIFASDFCLIVILIVVIALSISIMYRTNYGSVPVLLLAPVTVLNANMDGLNAFYLMKLIDSLSVSMTIQRFYHLLNGLQNIFRSDCFQNFELLATSILYKK